MPAQTSTPPAESTPDSTSDPIASARAAAEVLEKLAQDRALLLDLPVEERTRLLKAAGQIYCPDPAQRRQLLKARQRRKKDKRIQSDDRVLNETGIRQLRRKPVFTTPNQLAPAGFEPREDSGDALLREVVEPQNCYTCKRDYTAIHHFYDQLC